MAGSILLRVFRASTHEEETLGATGSNRKPTEAWRYAPQPLTLPTDCSAPPIPIRLYFAMRLLGSSMLMIVLSISLERDGSSKPSSRVSQCHDLVRLG